MRDGEKGRGLLEKNLKISELQITTTKVIKCSKENKIYLGQTTKEFCSFITFFLLGINNLPVLHSVQAEGQ